MKTLYSFFEDKITEAMKSDIQIQNFNVEYYALDKDKTADVVTAKEEVANTGGYHLTGFLHDLSKTIAQKQQGEVTITFAMSDLVRKKQYLITIKYTHNREKGIPVFLLKADSRESSTNVNTLKINQSIITPKEKQLFSKLRSEAPQDFPAETFMKLLYLIYYSLKGILKTENYKKTKAQGDLEEVVDQSSK